MKIYINGSIKEFKGDQITTGELIIQLNLNGKRFAIERNGEIISKNYFDDIYSRQCMSLYKISINNNRNISSVNILILLLIIHIHY